MANSQSNNLNIVVVVLVLVLVGNIYIYNKKAPCIIVTSSHFNAICVYVCLFYNTPKTRLYNIELGYFTMVASGQGLSESSGSDTTSHLYE